MPVLQKYELLDLVDRRYYLGFSLDSGATPLLFWFLPTEGRISGPEFPRPLHAQLYLYRGNPV